MFETEAIRGTVSRSWLLNSILNLSAPSYQMIRMEESFVVLIKLLAKILTSYNSESGIRTRIVCAWSNSAIPIAFHSSNVMPQIAGRKILAPEEDNSRLMCEMFLIFAIF